MSQIHIPGSQARGSQPLRSIVRTVRESASQHPNRWSWGIWVLVTVVFACWTQIHFHPLSGPPWLGMTIRTATFATGTLAVREWFSLRWTPPPK